MQVFNNYFNSNDSSTILRARSLPLLVLSVASFAQIADLTEQKDSAYKERNLCVALIAKLALQLGYKAGIGLHEGENWDDYWRHIVFIDIPTKQLSWHIHDSELPLFDFLSEYDGAWDGHTTEEKYNRIKAWTQNTQ